MGLNARVKSILNAVPRDGRVLDLGAVQHDAKNATRNDWLHAHLKRVASDVIGLDIEESQVEILREQGYDIRVGDAEQFDLDDEFDAIVAGELIEHLSNPGEMLDRCLEHLRPGGRLVLSTPNPWSFVHVRRAFLDRISVNPEHTCWFGPTTLRQLVERHGFEWEYHGFVCPESGFTRYLGKTLWFKLFGSTHIVAIARKPQGFGRDWL